MDAKYRIKSKYKNVSVIQRNDLEWAVIDDNKNIIVPFGKYGWIEGFDENGLSRVRTEKIKDIAIQLETSDEEVEWIIGTILNSQDVNEELKYPKWGIIDVNGKEVLPVEYDSVWKFFNKNRKTTFAEKQGIRYEFSLEFQCIISDTVSERQHYNNDYDYKSDSWYAMTDGMYGDMPDGFDGDYDFLG